MKALSPYLLFFNYAKDLIAYAPKRFGWCLGLIMSSAFLSGAGILILIPILHYSGWLNQHTHGGAISEIISWLPAPATQIPIAISLGAFVCLIMIISGIDYVKSHDTAQFRLRFQKHFQNRLNRAAANAQWHYLLTQKLVGITHMISMGMPQVGQLTMYTLNMMSDFVLTLVFFGISLVLSPTLTLLTCVILLVVLKLIPSRQFLSSGEHQFSSNRHLQEQLVQFMDGIKTAKSYTQVDQYTRQFETLNDTHIHTQLQFVDQQSKSKAVLLVTSALFFAVVFFTGHSLLGIPMINLIGFLLVFSRLIPRINSLYQTYSRVLHLVPIYQDATQMLADCMANQEAKPSQEPVTLTRHIHLQDLGFSYGTTPVLEKVSCTIPINTTTAIVGLSGAGKTTLADLITGLLAPTTGHIICDNTVLTGDRTHAWRRQIGYVAQDPYLFHDTVKQNLLWVKPDATDDQLWKALQMASLSDVVHALPHGLDTIIGDKGVHLSGGERQRLALARALLRTPTVLVLDEATSALDRQNEEAIYTTLKKLHGTITILIIAHRWSTIRDADQVMVLNQNTLAEFGSPSQLFSSSQSLFHHLFSDQQKGVSLGA